MRRPAGADSRIERDDLPITRHITLAPFTAEALQEQRENLGEMAELTRWVWPTASGETHLNRSAAQQGLTDVYSYSPNGKKPAPLPGLRVTPTFSDTPPELGSATTRHAAAMSVTERSATPRPMWAGSTMMEQRS
jgi:hypothetical protein